MENKNLALKEEKHDFEFKTASEMIKSFRKLSKVTMEELAEKVGVSVSLIGFWENGRPGRDGAYPKKEHCILLEKVLKIPANTLWEQVNKDRDIAEVKRLIKKLQSKNVDVIKLLTS